MWGQVMQCESIINSSNRAALCCSPSTGSCCFPFSHGISPGGSTEQFLLFPCSVGAAAHCGGHSSPGAAGTDTSTNIQLQAQSTFSSKLVEKVTGKHPILSAPTAGTKPSSLLKSPLAGTGCRDYCHPSPRSKEWRQLLSNRPGDNATLLLLGRAMGQSASLQHSLG